MFSRPGRCGPLFLMRANVLTLIFVPLPKLSATRAISANAIEFEGCTVALSNLKMLCTHQENLKAEAKNPVSSSDVWSCRLLQFWTSLPQNV